MSRQTSNYDTSRYAGIPASQNSSRASTSRSTTQDQRYTYHTSHGSSTVNARARDSPYGDREMSHLSDSLSTLWTDSMSRYPPTSRGLYDASTPNSRYVDNRLQGSNLYASKGNLESSSLLTSTYSPPTQAYRSYTSTARTPRRNAVYEEPSSERTSSYAMPNFDNTYDNPSPAWYTSRTSTTVRQRSASPVSPRSESISYRNRSRSPPMDRPSRSTRDRSSSTTRWTSIRDRDDLDWENYRR